MNHNDPNILKGTVEEDFLLFDFDENEEHDLLSVVTNSIHEVEAEIISNPPLADAIETHNNDYQDTSNAIRMQRQSSLHRCENEKKDISALEQRARTITPTSTQESLNSSAHSKDRTNQTKKTKPAQKTKPKKKKNPVRSSVPKNRSKSKKNQNQQPKRKGRKIEVPGLEVVFSVKNEDVLCGRGTASNQHIGNKSYWIKVLEHREAYCRPEIRNNKAEKDQIAELVLQRILSQGGRFLGVASDEQKTEWYFRHRHLNHQHHNSRQAKAYVVWPDSWSLQKIKQALRDRHTPEWSKVDNEMLQPDGTKSNTGIRKQNS